MRLLLWNQGSCDYEHSLSCDVLSALGFILLKLYLSYEDEVD